MIRGFEDAPTVWDVLAFPGDAAAWAADTPPCPDAVIPATALDAGQLCEAGQLDAVAALEHHIGWLQARQMRMLAALAGGPTPGGDADIQQAPNRRLSAAQRRERLAKEWVREDVRAALGESAVGAGERLRTARELTGRLAPTLAALEAGRIRWAHVRYLTHALLPHSDDTAALVQHDVLPPPPDPGKPVSPAPDMARFRRRVRRAILKADPRTAEEQRADALADRRVGVTDNGDGTSIQFAVLPTEGAALVMAAINLIASRHDPDDPRTPDQRRADALVQLAKDALNSYAECPHCRGEDDDAGSAHDHEAAPRAGRRRARRRGKTGPAVQVAIALSTLLGLDEQPGELNGEPISAAHARRIAADTDASWRRLVTDDAGRLLDYGRTTYHPPADLARFITARDRVCAFPTCNRPACSCEQDHTKAWADGGETNKQNLTALCCRHHHGKHDAGWAYRRADDTGGIDWKSPLGHRYTESPATYPIDHTAAALNNPRRRERSPEYSDTDPPPF